MKFGAKRDPLLAQLGFFRAKFHSKSLYSVEKRLWESRSTPTLDVVFFEKNSKFFEILFFQNFSKNRFEKFKKKLLLFLI
jgi:hypothetical protein